MHGNITQLALEAAVSVFDELHMLIIHTTVFVCVCGAHSLSVDFRFN